MLIQIDTVWEWLLLAGLFGVAFYAGGIWDAILEGVRWPRTVEASRKEWEAEANDD